MWFGCCTSDLEYWHGCIHIVTVEMSRMEKLGSQKEDTDNKSSTKTFNLVTFVAWNDASEMT